MYVSRDFKKKGNGNGTSAISLRYLRKHPDEIAERLISGESFVVKERRRPVAWLEPRDEGRIPRGYYITLGEIGKNEEKFLGYLDYGETCLLIYKERLIATATQEIPEEAYSLLRLPLCKRAAQA